MREIVHVITNSTQITMNRKSYHSGSHRRPAYRDSKEEKAVKVYTINQESRYILVKGVPKISNITDELLKLFSLYGLIQEYRILEDYPDIEEFSTVYWIKYADIQSARVAKRKMNNHSFFGGFLKVIYAPEYEDVEDTRQKLIGRRKDVAWRLGQLKKTERGEQDGHTPGKTPRSDAGERNQSRPEEVCTSSSSPQVSTVESRVRPSVDRESTSQWAFPTLPRPPVVLPRIEWKSPPYELDPSIPRVPSAHATLPKDFNPYLDNDNPSANQIINPDKFHSPGQTSATSCKSNHARLSLKERSTSSPVADHTRADRHGRTISPRCRTSCLRPNGGTDFGGAAVGTFQRTTPSDRDLPSSSPWVVTGRRDLDKNKQPQGDDGRTVPRGGIRPKAVPRKRFVWTGERMTKPVVGSTEGQQFLGQRQNPAPLAARNPGEEPYQHQDVQRQVRHGLKRRAEPDVQAETGSSDAESLSFDQSVLNIRERMRQVHNPATTTTGNQGHAHPSDLSASSGQNHSGGGLHLSSHSGSGPPGNRTDTTLTLNQRRADPSKRRRI